MSKTDPGFHSKATIASVLGIAVQTLDKTWRPKLAAGCEIRDKQGRILLHGPSVVRAMLKHAAGSGHTASDERELRETKLKREIEQLEARIGLLQRDIAERDKENVPVRELKVLFGTLGQVTRSTCLQAEKQFGIEGRELFEEMWRAFERNFRRLTGELDDGVALCKLKGRSWRPIDLKM